MACSFKRNLPWIAVAALLGGLLAGSPARANAPPVVKVLHAGSLITLFQRGIIPAFAGHGYEIQAEGRGSVANANLIKDGLKTPDLWISADDKVAGDLMHAAPNLVNWYATFATSAIVIGYSPKSKFAPALAGAGAGKGSWLEVVTAPGFRLGRTDPAIDPKGYRTIIVNRLAESHYGARGFAARALGADRNDAQIFNDETILIRLENGDLDGAFLYQTEAVSRKLPFIALPAAINLGDPKFAAHYASASVTIEGITRVGAPIGYALTIPRNAANPQGAAALVNFLLGTAQGRGLFKAAGLDLIAPAIVGERSALPAALRK